LTGAFVVVGCFGRNHKSRVAEERFAEVKQAAALVEAARESGFGVHR